MDEYLILVDRRTVGNSALWWRAGGKGYTSDPYDAVVYTREEAQKITASIECTFWSKAAILQLAEHHVDIGKIVEKLYE